MDSPLSESLAAALSDFLAAEVGLHFPKTRWDELARRIAAVAPAFGMPDAEACARRLLSAPLTRPEIEVLAGHLTVGETYFFRDERTFQALEAHILPALLGGRDGGERRLRIWSAGCATGEEPYSIAIALDRLIGDWKAWNVTILATDINPAFLRKAAEGVYGEWSFRNAPPWLRGRYFRPAGRGRFETAPHVRDRVTFSHLNLAADAFPALLNNTNAMDVIFCRNVLMYFTEAQARRVVERFHRSLVDGGWLFVSPTECSATLFPQFAAVAFPGTTVYRKAAGKVPGLVAASPAFSPPPLAPVPQAPPPLAPPPYWPAPPAPAAAAPAPPPAEEAEGEALCRTARALADRGELAEAALLCERAIAADKVNPAYHYLSATIRQELGQRDMAARSLGRALYLDPEFVVAHVGLGYLRLAEGRRREAERSFRNALALLGTHPGDRIVPESEGLTAGRLGEVVAAALASLPGAARTRGGNGHDNR